MQHTLFNQTIQGTEYESLPLELLKIIEAKFNEQYNQERMAFINDKLKNRKIDILMDNIRSYGKNYMQLCYCQYESENPFVPANYNKVRSVLHNRAYFDFHSEHGYLPLALPMLEIDRPKPEWLENLLKKKNEQIRNKAKAKAKRIRRKAKNQQQRTASTNPTS